MTSKHSHYHKDVRHLDSIDVYRIIELFQVTDGAAQHALKKLLCAGQRGSKTFEQDLQEAHDTLTRRLAMFEEDRKRGQPPFSAVGDPEVVLFSEGGGVHFCTEEQLAAALTNDAPLPPLPYSTVPEPATHLDGGGCLYRQHENGRWLAWSTHNGWYYASADKTAIPKGLRVLGLR